jgi:hypothetical protein
MSQHPLNIRPASMTIDGREWVPAEWAYSLYDRLRQKQRSQASHNHQFAEIHDLWANLPHNHAQAPYAASAEAFRKHGLIATGHCDVETIDCESHEVACRVAPVVAANARKAHGYALVVVRGPLVVCSTPHSQSFKAMGRERFHQSKADVLEWGKALLEVAA